MQMITAVIKSYSSIIIGFSYDELYDARMSSYKSHLSLVEAVSI